MFELVAASTSWDPHSIPRICDWLTSILNT